MPPGDYAQEKALKQEEKLIGQLERLELSSDLLNVLQDQVLLLLDGMLQQILFTIYDF
jgi:replication initiation and membrane attachment protein DnaB